jgi:hypothetical protein
MLRRRCKRLHRLLKQTPQHKETSKSEQIAFLAVEDAPEPESPSGLSSSAKKNGPDLRQN